MQKFEIARSPAQQGAQAELTAQARVSYQAATDQKTMPGLLPIPTFQRRRTRASATVFPASAPIPSARDPFSASRPIPRLASSYTFQRSTHPFGGASHPFRIASHTSLLPDSIPASRPIPVWCPGPSLASPRSQFPTPARRVSSPNSGTQAGGAGHKSRPRRLCLYLRRGGEGRGKRGARASHLHFTWLLQRCAVSCCRLSCWPYPIRRLR